MSERVHLHPKECLPPHGGEPDNWDPTRRNGSHPLATWLFVVGVIAILAYVLFFSFRG